MRKANDKEPLSSKFKTCFSYVTLLDVGWLGPLLVCGRLTTTRGRTVHTFATEGATTRRYRRQKPGRRHKKMRVFRCFSDLCVCFSTACHLERAEANGRRLQWNPEDRAQHCKTHDCGAFLEHSSKWTEISLLKSSLLPNICQVQAQVQQQKLGAKEKENDINLKVKIE